ncbi:MAG: glycosyl transferase family 2 [Methylomarinum sp.]|nr:glycosyl transferase family 2 [Methylomarinum sp.]
MQNSELAIAIPTYNRSEILKENLLYMIVELKKFNIPVYISDDSPNDDTRTMVNELKRTYEYIYYSKNIPALGHDENCFATLNLPEAAYIWYLGDSMIIESGGISSIVKILFNENYDFIITNCKKRALVLNSALYKNKNDVFNELAWHLTLSGCCIYKKEIIEKFNKISNYKNFPQTSIILATISEHCNLFYSNEVVVYSNKNKNFSYWQKNVFDVFGKDWFDFISCIHKLPSNNFYKSKVIKSHSKNAGTFGLKALLNYRILGFFNINILFKYAKYIRAASHINFFIALLISVLPRKFLKKLKSVVVD